MHTFLSDLVVVKGRKIAFSNYQVKGNENYMRLSLETFFRMSDGALTIPLSCKHNFLLNELSVKKDQVADKYKVSGPLMISIYDRIVNEYVANGVELSSPSIPISRHCQDSFYARATSIPFESASTAACLIYDDVATIYRETFKANGYDNPPFYTGDIDVISERCGLIYKATEEPASAIMVEIEELESKPKTKQVEKRLKQLDDELKNIWLVAKVALRGLEHTLDLKLVDGF